MKSTQVSGYIRKTKEQLLKEINECKSLSQLFALIQHEGIVIQMHSQSGASNLTPKKLDPKEIIKKKDTPLDRLKAQVRKAVIEQLLKEINECKSLSQLFALIQHEGIVIQMHSQSGASNLTPKKLDPKEIIKKKDTPLDRLKAQVRKAVEENCERKSNVIAKAKK